MTNHGGPSQATRLLGLLTKGIEFFHTPGTDGKPYATIAINGNHEETWAVHSRHFRNYLAHCFYESE